VSVLEICGADIEEKGIELKVGLDAERPLLDADPARMQQVFWNLVKNAVKFTPAGGAIGIRSRNSDGELVIEVSYHGVGIERALLPTIFDAFRQGDYGTGGNAVGLGLGLAISKSLMELHGGRLMAMSEGRNRGATFTVAMKAVDNPAILQRRDDAAAAGGARSDGNTILLVEDHADTAMMMKLLLERKGYQVNVAPNMTDALDLAAREPFDLLISDIGLPDGSGIELINTLNQHRPVKGIALSGFGMEDDIKRSIEAGFAEHLIKPVSYQKLREAIQRLLS
jgi:two-component system CheB/CheR fusion protein